jgi:glucose/arabinose dehydrogenase
VHGRRLALVVSLLVLLAFAPEASGQAQLTPVADFDGAMYLTAPPGDSRRLFVVEQDGYIRVVRDGVKLGTPFLDIDSDVDGGGEEGLLSMAFAPDYATSRKFYVYYTGNDGNNHVEEFEQSATDPDLADKTTRRQVLELVHTPNSNHNGGQLQFGPDGYLYVGTGDGGDGDDPPNNAQTLTGDPFDNNDDNPLLGKLLRIDPRQAATEAYTIPADNPYAGSPGGARAEIWSYGLRNPWRFSFDRATGDLWIGDVGQGAQEEIDFASRASGPGKDFNWGWRCWEGTRKNTDVPACDPPNDVFPVLVQPRATGFRAIVGGYVIRDPSLGSLTGRYVYGDNSVSALRSFHPADPAGTDAPTGHSVPGLTSFGEDASGRTYAVSFGRVFRFDPVPGGPGGGNGGPGGDAADTTPPGVTLSRKRRQPILRQRGVILAMTCSEACSASATGWISFAGAARVFKLHPVRRSLATDVRARVKLRLRRKAVRPLRRALRRGQTVRSRVRVLAVDPAGNAGVVKRRVSWRRP